MHATFSTSIWKVQQRILTVDTVVGLFLIDETLLPPESKKKIIPVSDIILSNAMNHRFTLKQMFKLYVCMRDAIYTFYLRIVSNLPPRILAGASFISKNIKTICPTKSFIRQVYSRPLLILDHNDRNVLAIQHLHPLEPFDQVERSVIICIARKNTFAQTTQRLITVNAPVNRLMPLQSHQRSYERHNRASNNGIAEIQSYKPFQILLENFS